MSRDAQEHTIVVGHFHYLDDTLKAIRKLREEKLDDLEVFSPFPQHDLEDEIYRNKKRSPVRRFTLLGGLCGCLGAFLMTCWMSQDYPLRTSAKTVLSIPAFVVIAFECTILLGGIFTLLSMFHFSRIPNMFYFPNYRPDFSKDEFGVTVRVPKEKAESVKAAFESGGAKQVEVQYAR
jgi:hypothetical protein